LFAGAPGQFDSVLTNPPFGSKEGNDAQARFAFKTGKAQILFLQHIIDALADGGTCGMVIDEGVLFHTKTATYKQTKRKLLDECDLWCVISLPQGVFVNAGAGVKTDLLFFTKGRSTERVWYYDMTLKDDFTPRKVNKGNPLTFADVIADRAAAVILAHNHPSGELRPSDADFRMHHQLQEAARILGLRVFEHIIVARRGYFSFHEAGLVAE
jgi:type I restriction enzyme M protein